MLRQEAIQGHNRNYIPGPEAYRYHWLSQESRFSQDERVDAAAFEPLPYHVAIRDFLKREDSKIWDCFASNKARSEHADAVRFDLLKKTYRVERDADPELYAAAQDAAQALSLDVPMTIYQSQTPEGLNAGLAYVPGEAHIVLSGPVKATFNPAELRALMRT